MKSKRTVPLIGASPQPCSPKYSDRVFDRVGFAVILLRFNSTRKCGAQSSDGGSLSEHFGVVRLANILTSAFAAHTTGRKDAEAKAKLPRWDTAQIFALAKKGKPLSATLNFLATKTAHGRRTW
jgi:hypothetical protein